MPFIAISEDDWLHAHTDVWRNWVNDITDLRRNAFVTVESLNNTACAFHLFEAL